jgi:hypothetical protein
LKLSHYPLDGRRHGAPASVIALPVFERGKAGAELLESW